MVLLHENIVGIDSAIFMHPTIWKASGHVDAFNDPLIDNKDSKKRYRADVLIEDCIAKMDEKIEKEVEKAAKRFGDSFDENHFRATNPTRAWNTKPNEMSCTLVIPSMNDVRFRTNCVKSYSITKSFAPSSGTNNWTDVRQFNLMFSTEMGSTSDGSMKVYLRPETAQVSS